MCVQFLKRERNLTQPTIDLYLSLMLYRRSSSISSTALLWNILTDCPHGFRAKRSTEMQLILTLHDMAKAIQSSSIHAVVSDFAKAFDKVPHRRLLRKPRHYGIQGPLLNWLESFLTQRFPISCLWRPNINSMSGDFWRTAGYSPRHIALFIIYKRLTR